jgi:hypothetical protein
MQTRCFNPNSIGYKNYGGRGITVCPEWVASFEAFFEYLGDRPSPKHTVERVDNNRGYEPGNVVWATKKRQARNRRSSRLVTAKGFTMTLVEWYEHTGNKPTTIAMRLARGWDPDRAVGTPPDTSKHRKSVRA